MSKKDLQSGDLLLFVDNGRGHHTQVVTSAIDDKVEIRHGNFDSDPIRMSADPQALWGRAYIGAPVQRGTYDR